VDELAADRDLERALVPRYELDRRELMAEGDHQRLGEADRLRLVAALGAVADRDLDRSTGRH
jgi:hypothetical protein